MFNRHRHYCSLIFCAIVVFVTSDAKAEIVIDDYTAGSVLAQFGAGTNTQMTLNGSILGGTRISMLNVPSLGGSEFFGVIGFTGFANIAQGANDRVNGSFLYDNFGSIDLTQGNNFAFDLINVSVDSAATLANAMTITVGSGASTASHSFDLPGGTSTIRVTYDNFAGIDFTNVDSIELGFDFATFPGVDMSIGQFVAIPEPSSFALAALAGSLFMFRRRRVLA